MNRKNKVDEGYKLIPMSEIDDEAREIAVRWAEGNGYDWIGDKHKLASDIVNYATKQMALFAEWIDKSGLQQFHTGWAKSSFVPGITTQQLITKYKEENP